MKTRLDLSPGACVLALAAVVGSCDTGSALAPVPLPSARCTPPPGVAVVAPLRASDATSDGCTPVGAAEATMLDAGTGADWPDVSSAAAPVVFVSPSAAADGDGSRDLPFATIAAALAATPAPGTLALARGVHVLAGPVRVSRVVALVGAGSGAGGTVVSGGATLPVMAAEGAAAQLSLSHFAVRHDPGAPADMALGAVAANDGAHLALADVVFEDTWIAVRIDHAVAQADALTVRRAQGFGVWAREGSELTLTHFAVVDGATIGVLVQNSWASLDTGLVARNGREGLSVLGGAPRGPVELERVALVANRTAGITVRRTVVTVGGVPTNVPGIVRGARLVVAESVLPTAGSGGDGIYVGAGGELRLDTDINSDAQRGAGSEIVANARTGILVDGDGAAMSSGLEVHGALVGANAGGGIFLQNGAHAAGVDFTLVDRNAGFGVAASSGATVMSFRCDMFRGTRPAMIGTTVGPLMLADGLAMSEGTSIALVDRSRFDDNARFAAVFDRATAVLRNNTGEGNGFGITGYGGGVDLDASNTVRGRADAPTTRPADFATTVPGM